MEPQLKRELQGLSRKPVEAKKTGTVKRRGSEEEGDKDLGIQERGV